MFLINSILASILFDSRASHSFIYARYANTHELPYIIMRKPMVVITPKGPIETNYTCSKIDIAILGRNFWSTPVILEESEIDLTLGMKWLKECNVVIHYAKGTVELTSLDVDRFEIKITLSPSTKPAIYLLDGKFVGDHICVVRDFLDVFPEELLGLPLDREVEFVIDILPRTTPVSKRPYRMLVEELKELKK
jgi:hypothetical protein